MKAILIVLWIIFFGFLSVSHAGYRSLNTCDMQLTGGDAWPWSVAQPFPWDNIEGFWKIGEDSSIYLNAQILSSNHNRKILSLSIHKDSVCSKTYAKGTGYIDIAEKNVVRALVVDGVYKYQLKIAMFDIRDVAWFYNCEQNVMGISMQLIGRVRRPRSQVPPIISPNDNEAHNIMLKKVSQDTIDSCKE